MTILATDVMTYADWATRVDPENRTNLADIIEILNVPNPVMTDMMVMQCNDGTGHMTTMRTGLPQGAWRMLNYGVPQVKTQTAQIRDTTGMLQVYSECDKKLADMMGEAAFRFSEAKGIMEGLTQQMAGTVFYGNTNINPERFLGLAPRYSDGVVSRAASGANVINGGSVNDMVNSSIWLVTWGERATHGLFPRGSAVGLSHRDLGEHTLVDSTGGKYQGYRDTFEWDLGLTVRDWRQNVRVANIDMTRLNDLTYIKTIITLLIQASEQLPVSGEDSNTEGSSRKIFYMHKRVRTALRLAILDKVASNLTWETFNGKRLMMFDDIPVHRVDALLATEALVPFV